MQADENVWEKLEISIIKLKIKNNKITRPVRFIKSLQRTGFEKITEKII